jgi:hypothetical protein
MIQFFCIMIACIKNWRQHIKYDRLNITILNKSI